MLLKAEKVKVSDTTMLNRYSKARPQKIPLLFVPSPSCKKRTDKNGTF